METPATFYEVGGTELTSVFLTDEENSRALDRYVNVCTDVIFIDESERFVLAHRSVAAARGWWWKGGGMRKGETTKDSIARLMKREVGFIPEGIHLLHTLFHQWAERKVPPIENGQHDLIFLHYVKVDEETIANIKLDPAEYDAARGFLRYDGSQEVRPVIKEMYALYKQLHTA